MPQANYSFELEAKEDGYVAEIIADEVGTAAMLLGAGRATKESTIDLAVGLILKKKIGDQVQKGESLVTIYSNFENIDEVREKLYENIKVSSTKVEAPILIYGEITE
jgi:pyrimidine-nucleoside phosphorylase